MTNNVFNFRLDQPSVDGLKWLLEKYQPGDYLQVNVGPDRDQFILIHGPNHKQLELLKEREEITRELDLIEHRLKLGNLRNLIRKGRG